MPFRLFPSNKVNKQKSTIEDDFDKKILELEKKAREILEGEADNSSPNSVKKSEADTSVTESVSGNEFDSETANILKAAEKLLANNRRTGTYIYTLDENFAQDPDSFVEDEDSIEDSASEKILDFEAQEVIFKLYPEKLMDAIMDGTIKENKKKIVYDEFFLEAGRFIIKWNKPSIGVLQRVFKIGFNRAARIMEQLAMAGVVSEERSTQARQVLMALPEFEAFVEKNSKGRILEVHSSDEDWGEINRAFWGHRTYDFTHDYYKRAEEQLNKETEALLTGKFQVPHHEVCRSSVTIDNLKGHKNCIITSSKFNTPFNFVLNTMEKCSPARLHLILIDSDGFFSKFRDYYLLHRTWPQDSYLIEILKWCIGERDKRQKETLDKGNFEYQPEIDTNELPIMIVVRELHNILKINGVRDLLLQLLVNSYQFGIYLIGFSQYDQYNLGINLFRDMVDFNTEEEVFELFTEDKTYHVGKLSDQLINTSGNLIDIDSMDGISFEKYCATVLKANRFIDINVTKASGDYGADIVAVRDQIKYAIQCKRSVTPIGNKAVQEVIASRSVYNCHVGVVLTNNYFTNSAKVLASKNNILLWDRNELLKMSSLVTP